jgi:hypothetical protein
MSATEERQLTWPTIGEVDAVVDKLVEAYNAVDEMSVRCYRLVNEDEPWERSADVPVPTLADVGALSRLASSLRGHMRGSGADNMSDWLENFEQMVESAASFEAHERGQR